MNKEKLYYISYCFTIYGNNKCAFTKKYPVDCTKTDCSWYVVSSEDEIENKILEKIKSKIDDYKEEIKENKYIELTSYDFFHYSTTTFREISYYHLDSFDFREATIDECLENLTPDLFKKLYGNIGI